MQRKTTRVELHENQVVATIAEMRVARINSNQLEIQFATETLFRAATVNTEGNPGKASSMRASMVGTSLLSLLLPVLTGTLYGQNAADRSSSAMTFTITERAKGMSIPDPDSLLSLAAFLTNESVMRDLRMNEADKSAVLTLLRENKGILTAQIHERDSNGKRIISETTYEQFKAKNLAVLDELLDPRQQDRLQQIAYHIEISRVGLAQAIMKGCLGKKLDVQGDQLMALEILISDAEKDLAIALDRIQRKSNQSILDVLTQAQKNDFQRLIGKPFLFREQTKSLAERKIPAYLRPAEILQPNNPILLASLLKNDSVAAEVGIIGSERASVFSIGKAHAQEKESLFMESTKDREAHQKLNDEVDEKHSKLFIESIGSSAFERLREVAYQIEIHRMGLRQSFLQGSISIKLEITEAQKKAINDILQEPNSGTDEEIKQAGEACVRQILTGLQPLQRKKLNETLGDSFVFVE